MALDNEGHTFRSIHWFSLVWIPSMPCFAPWWNCTVLALFRLVDKEVLVAIAARFQVVLCGAECRVEKAPYPSRLVRVKFYLS